MKPLFFWILEGAKGLKPKQNKKPVSHASLIFNSLVARILITVLTKLKETDMFGKAAAAAFLKILKFFFY